MARLTPADIASRKNQPEAFVALTAYTAPMATILDRHVDILLVGDSVGMALYGMDNTLGVTLDMMIQHGRAVMRASAQACVVVDMPYGTYEDDPEQALRNASEIIEKTGCQAIKLEGGKDFANTIETLVRNGIPVMGHIGLLPQSVVKEGGYKIKGRDAASRAGLIEDARALEAAGAFSFVIEGTMEDSAAAVSQAVSIPSIGIGASNTCDGQVLVSEDLLGLLQGHTPKFARKYAALADDIDRAARAFSEDVRARRFPGEAYVYTQAHFTGKKK